MKRKFYFTAAQASTDYNVGYAASNLYQRLGVPYTHILREHLLRKDKWMDKPGIKKMRNKRLEGHHLLSNGLLSGRLSAA